MDMMSARLRLSLLLAVATLLLVATVPAISPPSSSPRSDFGRVTSAFAPSASNDTITSNGRDPQGISLTWAQTSDSCFRNYTLETADSTSNGPWRVVTVITSASTASYVATGLAATTFNWWRIIDYDCHGSQPGNVYLEKQPAAPTLTFSQPTETSAMLSWTNSATYGGALAFGNYTVWESINGDVGPFTSVSTITTLSDTGYNATGLSLSTSYWFYVITTDIGSGTPYTGSQSSPVQFQTPYPLSTTTSASPSSLDAGQSTTLNCTAKGGVQPRTYSWTFGDGQTGTGASVVHQYSSSGSFNATCTVTDAMGLVATSSVVVTVTSTVAGIPATEVYAVIGGSIATAVVVVSVVMLLLQRRWETNRPPPQPSPPAADRPSRPPAP